MIYTSIFEPVHGFEILLMCNNNCKLNCQYSFNSNFTLPINKIPEPQDGRKFKISNMV
jgi:hypothetical protein